MPPPPSLPHPQENIYSFWCDSHFKFNASCLKGKHDQLNNFYYVGRHFLIKDQQIFLEFVQLWYSLLEYLWNTESTAKSAMYGGIDSKIYIQK